MGTAEILDRGDGIVTGSVDREFRAKIARWSQLLVGDVDRDDASTLDVGVLDGEVSQAADTEDGDEIRGFVPPSLTALYVVTPAQVNGAASCGSTPSGTLTTYRAYAVAYSPNPPSMLYPMFFCSRHSVSHPETQ
jgi:hypothetical protein